MEFVDFVPGEAFDYIIPPKVLDNDIISLWAFSDPDNLLEWKGIIWKLYLLANEIDNDAYVKFHFQWEGQTVDTNLSAIWGVDTLKQIHNGIYTLDGEACVHEVNNIEVEWWVATVDYEEAIEDLVDTFEKKGRSQKIISFVKSRSFLLILWVIVLLFLILILNKNKWKVK
jgi:hypothetical protein